MTGTLFPTKPAAFTDGARYHHPGGRGPCIHCKRETGAICATCGHWSCAVKPGCMNAHTAACDALRLAQIHPSQRGVRT